MVSNQQAAAVEPLPRGRNPFTEDGVIRDADGVARVRRTFRFEFSEDGFARRTGCLVMLGGQVESLQLEPYRLS